MLRGRPTFIKSEYVMCVLLTTRLFLFDAVTALMGWGFDYIE